MPLAFMFSGGVVDVSEDMMVCIGNVSDAREDRLAPSRLTLIRIICAWTLRAMSYTGSASATSIGSNNAISTLTMPLDARRLRKERVRMSEALVAHRRRDAEAEIAVGEERLDQRREKRPDAVDLQHHDIAGITEHAGAVTRLRVVGLARAIDGDHVTRRDE